MAFNSFFINSLKLPSACFYHTTMFSAICPSMIFIRPMVPVNFKVALWASWCSIDYIVPNSVQGDNTTNWRILSWSVIVISYAVSSVFFADDLWAIEMEHVGRESFCLKSPSWNFIREHGIQNWICSTVISLRELNTFFFFFSVLTLRACVCEENNLRLI